jgi:anti-anti-sigma factor
MTVTTSRERSEKSTDGTFSRPRSAASADRTIISLHEGLDVAAAPALREALIHVLHRGTGLLILDLSDVPTCDAAGLAVLIGTQRRAGLLGTTMRLVAPSLPVMRVLRSTGLGHRFTICPDLSGALASKRHEPARLASAPAVLAGASSC